MLVNFDSLVTKKHKHSDKNELFTIETKMWVTFYFD